MSVEYIVLKCIFVHVFWAFFLNSYVCGFSVFSPLIVGFSVRRLIFASHIVSVIECGDVDLLKDNTVCCVLIQVHISVCCKYAT